MLWTTESVKFLVCVAHHSSPPNVRSLYRAQQDRSELCHTGLGAARRKLKEIHSDVNGDLIENQPCDSFSTVDFVT